MLVWRLGRGAVPEEFLCRSLAFHMLGRRQEKRPRKDAKGAPQGILSTSGPCGPGDGNVLRPPGLREAALSNP